VSGSERLRTVALGTTTMAALAGAGVSAYLWARAFTGGAELVVRQPSVEAVKQEAVPALIAVAEPRRQARRPAPAATVIRVGVVRAPSSAVRAPRATPVSRPSAPRPAPTPPAPTPATPPTPPQPPPSSPPTEPAAPTPQPAPAPAPPPAPSPGGAGTPAAAPATPPAAQPSPTPADDEDRKRGNRRKEHERATPARPAIPPHPQEQKPPPGATPAVPAVPPPHDADCDDRGENEDHDRGNGRKKP
jgi:hypothetical protein